MHACLGSSVIALFNGNTDGIIINNMGIASPQGGSSTTLMSTEKYYVSNEDFLLYDTNSSQQVVTEQMTAYPVIDLSAGDSKQTAFDQYAIFRQGINITNAAAMDFGVEEWQLDTLLAESEACS